MLIRAPARLQFGDHNVVVVLRVVELPAKQPIDIQIFPLVVRFLVVLSRHLRLQLVDHVGRCVCSCLRKYLQVRFSDVQLLGGLHEVHLKVLQAAYFRALQNREFVRLFSVKDSRLRSVLRPQVPRVRGLLCELNLLACL